MSTSIHNAQGADSRSTDRRRPLPQPVRLALRLDLVVAGIAFGILTVITFTGALSRYLLDAPFVWLGEAQLALFLVMVFLGLGAAVRSGGHVAIDVVTDQLPERIRRRVAIFTTAVVVLVLGYFAWQSLQQVLSMAQLGRETALLRVPSALIFSAAPLGYLLMILNSVLALFFRIEDEDLALEDDLQEDSSV